MFDQFKYVQTHAIPSAPAVAAESAYPVLIFASGRGGFRQDGRPHLLLVQSESRSNP